MGVTYGNLQVLNRRIGSLWNVVRGVLDATRSVSIINLNLSEASIVEYNTPVNVAAYVHIGQNMFGYDRVTSEAIRILQ